MVRKGVFLNTDVTTLSGGAKRSLKKKVGQKVKKTSRSRPKRNQFKINFDGLNAFVRKNFCFSCQRTPCMCTSFMSAPALCGGAHRKPRNAKKPRKSGKSGKKKSSKKKKTKRKQSSKKK